MNTPTLDLPANIEAERAILGAILLSNGELYPDVAAQLGEGEFSLPSHRVIFVLMGRIKGPIDQVTLAQELLNRNSLQSIGGAVYLSHLTDGMPKLTNIEHYVGIVKQKSALRQLAHTGEWIGRHATAGDELPEEVLAEAQKQLADLQAKRTGGFVSLAEAYREEFPEIDSVHLKWAARKGLETGFRELDRMTGGLHPGNMVLLAARPSMGKTSLALNIAANVAAKGVPVGVFSLEMSRSELMLRLLCSEANVNAHKLQGGYATPEERRRLVDEGAAVTQWPIWIDEDLNRIETMASKAQVLSRKYGLGLLVIDYLQLMSTGKHENRVQEMSYISRGVKQMAKELRVPVLAVSQLSRAIEERTDQRPKLSDLRETGQLEQDADCVVFLWKESASGGRHPSRGKPEESADDGLMNVSIAKQRNGPLGDFKLVFEKKYTQFRNAWDGQEQVAALAGREA